MPSATLLAKFATLSSSPVFVNILDAISESIAPSIVLLSLNFVADNILSADASFLSTSLASGSVKKLCTTAPWSTCGSGCAIIGSVSLGIMVGCVSFIFGPSVSSSSFTGSSLGASSSLIILLIIGSASSTLLSRLVIVNFSLILFTVSSSSTCSSAVLKSFDAAS